MESTIKEIGQCLIKSGIKPSYQRIKVFEYLITRSNHPTVEQIYQELLKDNPTLSKTTVYNTLNTFINAGIARVVNIEDNETRYDADILTHGHFKCAKCKTIYDFEININNFTTTELEEFLVQEQDVYFKGICKNCL